MKLFQIDKLLILLIGAGITACSFSKNTFVKTSTPLVIDEQFHGIPAVDSTIAPYKRELDKEMNQVITLAQEDFVNERPSGNLGNLISDILRLDAMKQLPNEKVICLINFGGLRAPINKGAVTLGDVFKVMPFDNQIVYVKMPARSIRDIQAYLKVTTGEPIAGFQLHGDSILDDNGNPWNETDFWVVTSDYLVNGGDKMYFFQQALEVKEQGTIFRDVLIEYIKKQTVLKSDNTKRITWE